jgi:hypothetical protein
MSIGRRITAEGRATALAGAQMHPPVTGFDALFALVGVRRFEVADGGDVSTNRGHLLSLYCG